MPHAPFFMAMSREKLVNATFGCCHIINFLPDDGGAIPIEMHLLAGWHQEEFVWYITIMQVLATLPKLVSATKKAKLQLSSTTVGTT